MSLWIDRSLYDLGLKQRFMFDREDCLDCLDRQDVQF